MKNLTIFKNKEFGLIRTCMVDGETYFVGKDVASALGYANPTKAVTVHVDEEDRSMSEMGTLQRGNQSTIIINESGLYALILSSKLESAKRFKRWVTSEVLPQIRKNGRYELEHHNELLEKHNKQLTNQTRVMACRNALLEGNRQATEAADRLRTNHPEQYADGDSDTDSTGLRNQRQEIKPDAEGLPHTVQVGRTVDSLCSVSAQGLCTGILVVLRETRRRGEGTDTHPMDSERSPLPVRGAEEGRHPSVDRIPNHKS